jgi:hypothetical protein
MLAACGKPPQAKPAPAKKEAAETMGIELERGTDPRERLWIGTRGVVIGLVSRPPERKFFVDPHRSDMAWYLLRTYAPFERKAPEWDLSFRGQGRAKAGPAEQRMIFEWARETAAETAGAEEGTAYGLAFTWHQGGSSLDCEDVSVYLTGEAVASSCGWDGEVQGWLEPGALGRLYGWFDRLAPFQAGGGQTQESLRPNALETRLVFAGKGAKQATAAEETEVQSFGAALFAELAGRRNEAAPPPPPQPAAPGSPQAKTPAPAPVPVSHLLLPPGALNPRQEEVVVQAPEKPPAAPVEAPQRPTPVSPAPPPTQPPG